VEEPKKKKQHHTTILSDLAVLMVLLGLAYTLRVGSDPARGVGEMAMHVGMVLLVAGVAGRLALAAGLPRLTGYLIVGMLIGPSFLRFVDAQAIEDLRLIDKFALALIGLLAGGELRVQRLRVVGVTIATTTLVVTVVVSLGMAGLIFLIGPLLSFSGLSVAGLIGMALLLGIWAANSSPDLTVAVIEEVGSRGPLTDVILSVTIVKDIVVIILFSVCLAVVASLLVPGGASAAQVFRDVGWEVGGALVIGAMLGWVFSSFLAGPWKPRSPVGTFLFAFVMVVLADTLHLELLLLAASSGFLVENLSPAGDRLIRDIRSLGVVVFAFFFTVAGASLQLGVVRGFWFPALLFFLARVALTLVGARLGTSLAGAVERVRGNTGLGLISQGGVTMGLLLLLEPLPAVGPTVVAFGMAVILANILVGPVVLRVALTEEVPASATARPAIESHARADRAAGSRVMVAR
jgi:Kef-type K+ transport system membrane component KefB